MKNKPDKRSRQFWDLSDIVGGGGGDLFASALINNGNERNDSSIFMGKKNALFVHPFVSNCFLVLFRKI